MLDPSGCLMMAFLILMSLVYLMVKLCNPAGLTMLLHLYLFLHPRVECDCSIMSSGERITRLRGQFIDRLFRCSKVGLTIWCHLPEEEALSQSCQIARSLSMDNRQTLVQPVSEDAMGLSAYFEPKGTKQQQLTIISPASMGPNFHCAFINVGVKGCDKKEMILRPACPYHSFCQRCGKLDWQPAPPA